MARHRHSPSPTRSTVYHQDQCRQSATLPSVSQSKCTCSRTDFIPSWLQHVQISYNDTSRDMLRQASLGPEKGSWHPNGLPTVRIQSSYDAGKCPSSDLFIQDTPSPSPLASQTNHHRHHESDPNSDYGRDLDGRKGYYDSKPSVSTLLRVSIAEHDIFEKRPRRKTREDRYNAVKVKDVRAGKQQAKRSSTRVSKKGKLRSSREIMANFKSSAITNPKERITLKPSFTPGLFINGRGSAPSTDLVFNEIPSPEEGDKQIESERSSKPTAGRPKRDTNRQNEIEFLSNALRRLKEDHPSSESSNTRNSRANSITSSYDFQSLRRSIIADDIDDEIATGRADSIPRHGDSASGDANDGVGGNTRPSPKHDSYKLHIRSIYSISPTTESHISDLDMLNKLLPSDGNSIQETQRDSAARNQGLIIKESNNERNLGSCNPTKPVEYEDKGVMVSPRMHQWTEKLESGGENRDKNRIWSIRGSYSNSRAELHSPNTFPQMLPHERNQQDRLPHFKSPRIGAASIESRIHGYPAYLPLVSERPSLTTEVKDIHRPYSESSPAWFHGANSTPYLLHPYPNFGLSYVGDFESSKTLDIQSRDTCSVDTPAQLTNSDQAFRISQETHQDSNILCSDASHAIDDESGESLSEYIERIEREILGPAAPSTPCINGALLSAQDMCQSQIPGVLHTHVFNEARCSNNHLHGIELMDHLSPRNLLRQSIREELCWPSRQYQRLPCLEESLNSELESELASFWQPNHMMWY